MTSRERTLRAITFGQPDRLPLAKGEDADIAFVGARPARGFVPAAPGMDEWGCVWSSLNAAAGDQGQVTAHPLADWDAMRRYRFPDPQAPGRLEGLRDEVDRLRHAGKFVCASLGAGPMHRLDYLRGFEAYLMDLLTEPERIEWLLDGIFAYLTGLTEQFGTLGVDAVYLADDQAMQSGPLFAMDIWRERFKPRYRALFARAHALGCRVYMHTCGNLGEHLPELADAGVDLIDNKQPALWMNSPAVDAVRGRVAFSTCLDIQQVLQTIPLAEIEAAVASLVRRLALPAGGFIGTCYHQPDLAIEPEKNARMLDAFRSFSWSFAL